MFPCNAKWCITCFLRTSQAACIIDRGPPVPHDDSAEKIPASPELPARKTPVNRTKTERSQYQRHYKCIPTGGFTNVFPLRCRGLHRCFSESCRPIIGVKTKLSASMQGLSAGNFSTVLESRVASGLHASPSFRQNNQKLLSNLPSRTPGTFLGLISWVKHSSVHRRKTSTGGILDFSKKQEQGKGSCNALNRNSD